MGNNKKAVKLQHREYFGADHITKYVQHRINIPDDIIKRFGWSDKDTIVLHVRSHTKIKTISLELKTDNT